MQQYLNVNRRRKNCVPGPTLAVCNKAALMLKYTLLGHSKRLMKISDGSLGDLFWKLWRKKHKNILEPYFIWMNRLHCSYFLTEISPCWFTTPVWCWIRLNFQNNVFTTALNMLNSFFTRHKISQWGSIDTEFEFTCHVMTSWWPHYDHVV